MLTRISKKNFKKNKSGKLAANALESKQVMFFVGDASQVGSSRGGHARQKRLYTANVCTWSQSVGGHIIGGHFERAKEAWRAAAAVVSRTR